MILQSFDYETVKIWKESTNLQLSYLIDLKSNKPVDFEDISKYTDCIGINIDGKSILDNNLSTGFVEKAH